MGDAHALIKVENHLNDAAKQAQGGWQMPGVAAMGVSYKTMLFQIDGDKITQVGGVQEVRVEPGPHQVQVMVDDGLIPLSGDVTATFAQGHTYGIKVYHDEQANQRNRADLVDQASPAQVINQARF